MSEILSEIRTNVSEGKAFKITKAVPTRVCFSLNSFVNPSVKKFIDLTYRRPSVVVPLDYALGLFTSEGNYKLLQKGIITVSNKELLLKQAIEVGAVFDEIELPEVSEKDPVNILETLKGGKRSEIDAVIAKFGDDKVKQVAYAYKQELTQGVIAMLEAKWKVQLSMDGGLN